MRFISAAILRAARGGLRCADGGGFHRVGRPKRLRFGGPAALSWVLLGGSLAGVLGLALAAWLLGLGGGGIGSAEEAMAIAEQSFSGFDAERATVSADGKAALVFGSAGKAALIKQHGTQAAARLLVRPLRIQAIEGGVEVASGERRFGSVRLLLAEQERDKLLTMV